MQVNVMGALEPTSSDDGGRRFLSEATVQEIQFELMRRASFNAFDSDKIIASLERHSELWEAVLVDRRPHWQRDRYNLPMAWLIRLRDLAYNEWNVDTVFILTPTVEAAQNLTQIIADENWRGMTMVYGEGHREEVQRALGCWHKDQAVVTVWWD
jgi:hypothetical protein